MRLPLRGLATLSEHLDAFPGGRTNARTEETDRLGAERCRLRCRGHGAGGILPDRGGAFRAVPEGAPPQLSDLLFPFDLTVWGVVHLVIGVLLIAAVLPLRTARPWARSVGIAFAMISAVANFLFAVYSPAWSLTVIALDVVVIWALCTYRGEVTRA